MSYLKRRAISFVATLTLLMGTVAIAQQATITRSSNLRQSASTQSKILGSLKAGDSVILTSTKRTNGYYPAKAAGGTAGWVWAKNVSLKPSTSTLSLNVALPPLTPGEFTASCADAAFPGPATAMDSTGCPVSGDGGDEAAQNEAKNNFCASVPGHAIAITDLVQLQKDVKNKGDIPFGSPQKTATDRSGLENISTDGLNEGARVILTGYVAMGKAEEAESVNCGSRPGFPTSDDYHDIHISIVPTAKSSQCSGVVAEMIPHHRPASWTPTVVNQVATAGLPVRLTGNLMFDSSHLPCKSGKPVGKNPKRASLWEVHPIYKFEVCTKDKCLDGQGWVDLADWKP